MKTPSRRGALAVLGAGLLFGAQATAAAEGDYAPEDTTLPRQTSTHFFEVYHCGELEGVVWVTPGEAASFRTRSLRDPAVQRAALEARAQARDQGTAFAVHGKKGGCADA